MNRANQYLKYIFPILSLGVLLLVGYLSHQPGDVSGQESARIAEWLGVSDAFLRSMCHYVLFFLIALCFGISLMLWEKSLWWLSLILILCWLDEATKPWIMGRHFDLEDVGKNVIGAGCGIVVTVILSKLYRNRKS